MDAHSGPNAGIDPLGKPVIPAFRCASWRATGCNKLPEISTAGWLVALSKPAHPRIALRFMAGDKSCAQTNHETFDQSGRARHGKLNQRILGKKGQSGIKPSLNSPLNQLSAERELLNSKAKTLVNCGHFVSIAR